MGACLFQLTKSFTHTQASHFQALGGHQRVLIKQGNLKTSSTHIQNRGSFLNHFLEAILNGGNGLVSQEVLLRIAQNLHAEACPLENLFNDDNRVSQLTECTGGTGTVLGGSKFRHHALKISQDLTDRIHRIHIQCSAGISSCSNLQAVTDIIDFPKSDFLGQFKNFHADLIGADVYRRKCSNCHVSSFRPCFRHHGMPGHLLFYTYVFNRFIALRFPECDR